VALTRTRKKVERSIDLSDQDDVYIDEGPISGPAGGHLIEVTIDDSLMALPRLFGLMPSLLLTPAATESRSLGDGAVLVRLLFERVDNGQIDRLQRKLLQLPETISVEEARLPMRRTG